MGIETQLADARLANTTLRDRLRRVTEERNDVLHDIAETCGALMTIDNQSALEIIIGMCEAEKRKA